MLHERYETKSVHSYYDYEANVYWMSIRQDSAVYNMITEELINDDKFIALFEFDTIDDFENNVHRIAFNKDMAEKPDAMFDKDFLDEL